ncbi:MAG: DUF3179 domain-containing protein [Aureibaculum sp.]|nr:DUF3179 domain-containing protein [Aureibaculum sp.]
MKKNVIKYFLISMLISCQGGDSESDPNSLNPTDSSDNIENENEWLIPLGLVADGGPGQDGVPSIDNPKFIDRTYTINGSLLDDDDLVIGIAKGNDVRAYPHYILDWHEIVNDFIDGQVVAISYCPLTGTAFGWSGDSNGSRRSTFGTTGLLYKANLILYDRNTNSNWSQLRLDCVNGSLIGSKPILTRIVETNWKTWKALYPNTKVLSTDTGFSRNYTRYPYGSYKTDHDFFIFRAFPSNSNLPNKERVYAIIDGDNSKVYRYENFENGKVIKDEFEGKEILVVGNENLIYSFQMNNSNSHLDFEYDFKENNPDSGTDNTNVFFKDNEGNKWTIFGEAIDGPRTGEKLMATKSVVSYWFAIAAFYPNPKIYSE